MKRSIQLTILIGMLAIFALILGIALRVLHSTASSTDLAVKRVSEFYLKELAGRRAQVISSQIETKIDQMQRAMQVITGEDLESEDGDKDR